MLIKIETIEKYKGRTMKLTLSEGEPVFMNADIAARYGLKGGVSVPEAAWAEILHADIFRRARERAMYLLDYRDYSYADLVKKLMNNYDEDICFEVADKLAEQGFLNGALPYMSEKGIPASIIRQALEPYEENAAERAAELAKKKYMKYFDPEDRALMQKLKNALARNGYSYSEIKTAIELLKEEYE